MPLRLLHTADWHLGHVLREFDRTFEHESLIAWLLDTIEHESVDAVLVAGDVFDAANPPTAAQNLWFRFLVEAWRRARAEKRGIMRDLAAEIGRQLLRKRDLEDLAKITDAAREASVVVALQIVEELGLIELLGGIE